MGVHDGHRERLKERFIEHGLTSFNELNALEMLLFYAIPRKDTNPIAHALLDRFGSLNAVFDASVRELCEVEGIGQNAAVLISLIPQIMRKSLISAGEKNPVINSSREAAQYLIPRYMYEKEEFILLLCLDSKRQLIACVEVSRGVVNSVDANVRKVAETALKNRAVSVILAHNHPDSIAKPSREDDFVTTQVRAAMEALGIPMRDHIIVAGEEYFSYLDTGIYDLYRY